MSHSPRRTRRLAVFALPGLIGTALALVTPSPASARIEPCPLEPITIERTVRPTRVPIDVDCPVLPGPVLPGPVDPIPDPDPDPGLDLSDPTVTADGIGIRVDETAILGPVLDKARSAAQPILNEAIRKGVEDAKLAKNPEWVRGSSNLSLGIDFLSPTGAHPDGGITVTADVTNIEVQIRKDPWLGAPCSIWVRPDDAHISVTARMDASRLPNAPIRIEPAQVDWPEPDGGNISTSGVCWTYLIDDWFSGLWDKLWGNSSESSASKMAREIDDQLQSMLDDVWDERVRPTLDSLEGFGIVPNQLRTDTHGLIVTAHVDGSDFHLPLNGVQIPLDISDTVDPGVTSNVNTLLANRTNGGKASDVIVSVHPKPLNQALNGITKLLQRKLSAPVLDASIEQTLLPAAVRGNYADNGWRATFYADESPYLTPAPSDGRPTVKLPAVRVVITNTSTGTAPVATYEGSVDGVALRTEIRAGLEAWGPTFDPSTATGTVTRTQANADAAATAPGATDGGALAVQGWSDFNNTMKLLVTLQPIRLGTWLNVDLCTTCDRYAGDQRYTETFDLTTPPPAPTPPPPPPPAPAPCPTDPMYPYEPGLDRTPQPYRQLMRIEPCLAPY